MNGRSARDLRDDRGTTVLEVIVAMTLLTVFMGIFTTSIIMMTRTTTKVQNTAQAVEDGNTAFLTLDRTLRYATAISAPDPTGGVWHVEIASTELIGGVPTDVCTQLRVKGTELQSRSWEPAGNGHRNGTLKPFRPLASNVTNATGTGVDRPFTVPTANTAAPTVNQSLTVTLLTSTGTTGTQGATQRTSSTFTALNSTSTPPASICQQTTVGSAAT